MTSDGIQNQFDRQSLAEALNISEEKIDVFEEMALISERSGPVETKSYNGFDYARLKLILRCETAGYGIDEIREILGKINSGTHLAQQLQASLAHAQGKLNQIQERISQGSPLETINLRCDQDLLQGYINDINAIRLNLGARPGVMAKAPTPKKRFTLDTAFSEPEAPPLEVDQPKARKKSGKRVHPSKFRLSSILAWKQTAATFFILSLLTAAGYLYFNFKSRSRTVAPPVTQQIEQPIKLEQPEQPPETPKPKEPERINQPTPSASEPKMETTHAPIIAPPPPSPSASITKPTSTPSNVVPPPEPSSAPADAPSSLPQSALKDLNRLIGEKQPSPEDTSPKIIAARPQIAAYEFKAFFEEEKKILRVKFKMASIASQGEINQGHVFVVFKPRQSSKAEDWLCVPSSPLSAGVPLEPSAGEAFEFSGSKIQYLKGFFEGNPKQFDIATIYIFSNSNELVLRKEFEIDLVAY